VLLDRVSRKILSFRHKKALATGRVIARVARFQPEAHPMRGAPGNVNAAFTMSLLNAKSPARANQRGFQNEGIGTDRPRGLWACKHRASSPCTGQQKSTDQRKIPLARPYQLCYIGVKASRPAGEPQGEARGE